MLITKVTQPFPPGTFPEKSPVQQILEYFSDRPGLQSQKQAVPLVPHRKTLFS